MGYLSATSILCEERGIVFKDVYGSENYSRQYYIHGNDNIPFHTIILPSLLIAHGGGLRLPDEIISSEYITDVYKRQHHTCMVPIVVLRKEDVD